MDEKFIEQENPSESKTEKFSHTEKEEIKDTLENKFMDLHIGNVLPKVGLDLEPREQITVSITEEIHIPEQYYGTIEGTANMARMGIQILAIQKKMFPGFKGNITIEIQNIGGSPVYLIPKMKIAQLILHEKEK